MSRFKEDIEEIEEIDPVIFLAQKAGEQGYLTIEEILEVFPEAEENIEQLEEVFILLQETGIEIEGDSMVPVEGTLQKAINLLEEESKEKEEYDEETDLFDLSGISSDDTVGLYLKEMARVPLLSTEEEVTLAKLLERGDIAQRKLVHDGHTLSERENLERKVLEGKLAREHLILSLIHI